MVNYSNFNSSPDKQSPEFVPQNNAVPEFKAKESPKNESEGQSTQ